MNQNPIDTESTSDRGDPLEDLPPAIRNLEVGRLEEMPVRSVWAMEERHLTPWLAANLDVLEAELNLRLELVEREHQVGRYVLDLLLRSVDDDQVVIVENQFGASDHTHLGQLMAYAAGTEADVIVWIAESFTDEHLAALEWMNNSMGENTGFFAVTLKAVKIGDSLPAPIMETKLRPNAWLKETAHQRQVVQRQRQHWDWETFEQLLRVPTQRIAIAKAIAKAIEVELAERGLELRQQFRKGYLAFQRAGGYNVFMIDVIWKRVPRLIAKIPGPPQELGLKSPFPSIENVFDHGYNDWGFGPIATLDAIPDLAPLVDIVLPFHPESGPMTIPTQ